VVGLMVASVALNSAVEIHRLAAAQRYNPVV